MPGSLGIPVAPIPPVVVGSPAQRRTRRRSVIRRFFTVKRQHSFLFRFDHQSSMSGLLEPPLETYNRYPIRRILRVNRPRPRVL